MTKEMITVEKAREALVKVIEANGFDYIYAAPEDMDGNCMYNVDGKPSCLVGHAIHNIDPELFDDLSTEEANRILPAGTHESAGKSTSIRSMDNINIDYTARQALQAAQSAQDAGDSWGVALNYFDRTVAEFGTAKQ